MEGESINAENIQLLIPDHATVTKPFIGVIKPPDTAKITGLKPGDTITIVWQTDNQGAILYQTIVPMS